MSIRWSSAYGRFSVLSLIAVLALAGPFTYWAIQRNIERTHKQHLIEYICRVAEPRLQAGAFREVQDYLISSTRFFGGSTPIITLEESGRKYETGSPSANNKDVFACQLSGRSDVGVSFAFKPYQITGVQFGISFGAAFVLLLLLALAFNVAVRSAQVFAADLFQSLLARDLKLEALGISAAPAGNRAKWLPWIQVNSDLAKKINHQIAELQRAIRAQSDELAEKRADSAVAHIAVQIAHDIRSPLSAINMAVASLPDLPDDGRKLISAAAARINDIAGDLLVRRRDLREANGNRAATVHTRVADTIRSLLEEKRMEFSSRPDLEILGDLDEAQDVELNVDPMQLSRALSNLINNSADAIVRDGRIQVSARRHLQSVEVIVSDSGKGMPSEVLSRLGSRGVSAGKGSADAGFGLGVAYAKETVERAGGRLQIQSKVGLGTVVSLNFPLLEGHNSGGAGREIAVYGAE